MIRFSGCLADPNSYTAIFQGEEIIDSLKTQVVNVIPLSDTSDIVLGKFWIDPLQEVIIKTQFTTRSNGTIVTEYTYGNFIDYGLPDKMIFLVDFKKFRMAKNLTNSINKDNSGIDDKSDQNKKGKIIIDLTNYQINKGVPDNIFNK